MVRIDLRLNLLQQTSEHPKIRKKFEFHLFGLELLELLALFTFQLVFCTCCFTCHQLYLTHYAPSSVIWFCLALLWILLNGFLSHSHFRLI